MQQTGLYRTKLHGTMPLHAAPQSAYVQVCHIVAILPLL